MSQTNKAPDPARVEAAIRHLETVHRLCLLHREIEALGLQELERITPFPPRDVPALLRRQAD